MEIKLSRNYASCFGKPIVDRIDDLIFINKYYGNCLDCSFCNDKCCSYGVDIDIENVKRIEQFSCELEKYTNFPKEKWFKNEFILDNEFPGNYYTRTQTHEGHCIFLDKINRGCLIHRFCIENGIEFHMLKPIVSCLFPITFDEGLLHPSDEVENGSLICMNTGMSLYRGVKNDLEFYFGDSFISEMNKLEVITIKRLDS